ncbi:hypothetical protein Angca_000940, partial [Angiostrongylus cantonensis]
SLMNLSPTCFIAPKATGIVSLILQFALLIISVLVVLFFFYHVGGYEYMSWNENSTILEPIPHSKPLDSSATLAVELLQPKEVPNVGTINATHVQDETLTKSPNSKAEFTINTSTFLNIEQVPNTTVYLKFMDAILDMLELIRISTLVYVGICALWLMSIAFLLLSIKYEVLDMVSLNAVFLTVATMYAFAHALFIAVLLYYQRDLPWRTMAIVIGSAVILTFTAILGAVALALVIGWYRYIVYMNDSDK